MSLAWPVVLAVLGAALLHAAWNALIKSGRDKAADTALIAIGGAVVALPALVVVGLPRPAAWPFVAASLLVHVGYYAALAGAYRHGDLALTYPVMRGLAPLWLALGSLLAAALGRHAIETPSRLAWCGVVGIAAGVVLIGLGSLLTNGPGRRVDGEKNGDDASAAARRRKALGYAVANAAIIALYTAVDGLGVRTSGDALRYVLLFYVLDGLPYPLALWLARRGPARHALVTHARGRGGVALFGGAASLGAYGIALWAMTRAPIASVAALRETSVLFAALIGSRLLHERLGRRHAVGIGIIVAGVMALRFG